MDKKARIYVAGGTTLVGRALLERLRAAGFCNLVGVPPDEPDLTWAGQVEDFFAEARPECVFMTAGLSAGIHANLARPADLMVDNLLTSVHVIQAAFCHGVSRLLYLASSCMYPKSAPQPLSETSLLTGPPEPSSDAYALAKLAGWKLCDAYRRQHGVRFVTAIPANPFGPGDDFSADSGHVIPSLIRRMHEAKVREEESVAVWGTGTPRRDFIYAADLADACVSVMRDYGEAGPINLGSGSDLSIAEVARAVREVVGYRGRLVFDVGQPDGMPRKVLDSSRLFGLGWRPRTGFQTALEETYAWFAAHDAACGLAKRLGKR